MIINSVNKYVRYTGINKGKSYAILKVVVLCKK